MSASTEVTQWDDSEYIAELEARVNDAERERDEAVDAAVRLVQRLAQFTDYCRRIVENGDCGYFAKDEEEPAIGLPILEAGEALLAALPPAIREKLKEN